MRSPNLKQDVLSVAGLFCFGVVFVVSGYFLSQRVAEDMLKRNAYDVAAVWYHHLADIPKDVKGLVDGKGVSTNVSNASDSLRHFTHIMRYEIFTPNGRLAYSSLNMKDLSVPPLEAAFLVTPTAKLGAEADKNNSIHLFSSEDPHKPAHYAAVLFHLNEGENKIGSVIIYLDQSAEYQKIAKSFNSIAGITAILLIAILLVPLGLIGLKIRERHKAEKRIHFLAHYDPLTKCANRVTFNRTLSRTLENRDEEGGRVAVLFLDLDRFKEVNDTLGHDIGDELLKAFAKRISSCLRSQDMVARLSGDEFAILLTDIRDDDDIYHPVKRLVEKMNHPFELLGHQVVCTVSVGIAVYPNDGTEPDRLLKCADLALYRSKGSGRNMWSFYEPGMDAALSERRRMEDELRRALQLQEFELYFQPQIAIDTGKISGNEALLRWRHPDRGILQPNDFLDIAEESGLIIEIGEWVLNEACRQAAQWSKPRNVAVNLSTTQVLKSNISASVCRALEASGLDARRLELEIAEETLLCDTDRVLGQLDSLRDKGVSIAIDNFGTSYAGLVRLAGAHLDKVKLDRRFTRDIETDETIRTISTTIIGLSHSLGINIVAEGVESVAQVELLKDAGCDHLQGYLVGPPLPAASHAKLVDGGASAENSASSLEPTELDATDEIEVASITHGS